MSSLLQDLRYAFRQLRKNPGFATVAVLTLAIGIGANTAVFSVVNAVLLRPLPYAHPDRLVDVKEGRTGYGILRGDTFSYPDFFDYRSQNHTLEHLVSYREDSLTLTDGSRPVQVISEMVAWDLLPALGIQPEMGRGFVQAEEQPGTRVVLLSHDLWNSQFAADKAIIGKTITLSGNLYTVVGVMPKSFRFPVQNPAVGVWTTLAFDATGKSPVTKQRGAHFIEAIAVLKNGITVEQAQQDLSIIANNLKREYPDTNTKLDSAQVQPAIEALAGSKRTPLLILQGAVLLVLLIACGNLANLLLSRAAEREGEIAVRAAMGASRGRVLLQLLAESVLLGALGGTAGCVFAVLGTRGLLAMMGDSLPRAAEAGVDGTVLLFALFVSVGTGLIFGIAPALKASKPDLVSTLKETGRSGTMVRDRLRGALVMAQVALGLMLATAAGLLMISFIRLQHNNLGFDPHQVLTLNFQMPEKQYPEVKQVAFYRDYLTRVRALPGVTSAAGVMPLPLGNDDIGISFDVEERPMPRGSQPSERLVIATPGYFDTMRIPVVEGRVFTENDTHESSQVVVVNRSFAQKYFPGEPVLGKRIQPGANAYPGEKLVWREIIGVVADNKVKAVDLETEPAYFIPFAQLPWCCLTTVMRTSVDPRSMEASTRNLIGSIDKDLAVYDVRTMEDLASVGLAQPRFQMFLLSSFAVMALLLTAVGLYGLMAYSVARRTREIGVRMALGAGRDSVLGMVMREAGLLLIAGVAIGVMAALASGTLLRSVLYGAEARNAFVLVAVSFILLIAGALAAFIPARRAASIDPMTALRYE